MCDTAGKDILNQTPVKYKKHNPQQVSDAKEVLLYLFSLTKTCMALRFSRPTFLSTVRDQEGFCPSTEFLLLGYRFRRMQMVLNFKP